MRRLPDPPLRRGKPQFGAHRPVEKGVRVDRGRPDLLVEACDKDAVEREQARFEQAENIQAGMAAAGRRGADAGDRLVEQSGIVCERAGEAVAGGLGPLVHQRRQCVEPVGSGRVALRRGKDRGDRGAMQAQPLAQGGGRASAQRVERADEVAGKALAGGAALLVDATDGGMGVPIVGGRPRGGEGLVEIVERSERRGAENSELERPGGALELARVRDRSAPRDGRSAPER